MNHDYVNHGFILTVSGHNQYQSVFFVIIVNRAFVYYLAHPQTGGGGVAGEYSPCSKYGANVFLKGC